MKIIHGGDIYSRRIDYDFSANLNPLGIPESVRIAVCGADFEHYPDADCTALARAISGYENVPPEKIVCGNGAAEIIYKIISALKPKRALICAPTFSEYEKALCEAGCEVQKHYLREENDFVLEDDFAEKITPDIDAVFICCPNNPTGNVIDNELLKKISQKCLENNAVLVIDECFLDFVRNGRELSAKNFLNENIIIIKAFTKICAMAGLRLGFALFGSAKLAENMRFIGQPWSVSSPAQSAGIAATLVLQSTDYLEKTVSFVENERNFLSENLKALGIKVFPSAANFILFRCEIPLENALSDRFIAIRSCRDFDGLGEDFYRIAVRKRKENETLISALEEILNG